jgi:NADH-quinone oxidoreductase subunit C
VSEERKREEGRPEAPREADRQPAAARQEESGGEKRGEPAAAGRQAPSAAERQSPAAPEQQASPVAQQQEPANTQEVSGTEPAGAGAEHPNQPQPDTMPEHPEASASGKPAAPANAAAGGRTGGGAAAAGEGAGTDAAAGAGADTAAGGTAGSGAADPEREAKIKAAQEARAARLAAKAAAGGGDGAASGGAAGAGAAADPEREAKIKAAQEARAARLAAKAAAEAGGDAAPAEPKPPSPKQPWLDEAVELLKSEVHPEAVEEASINELSDDMPTIVVKAEHWRAVAELLKSHGKLGCNYLRNVTGVDYETHLEVVYFVINLETKREYAIKIRTDREQPSVPSATPVWTGANWPEREIYDLLGVEFPGHPDLRRILMPDDWVGHPLRKDYVPLDPEV